jgi:hypothetical protein
VCSSDLDGTRKQLPSNFCDEEHEACQLPIHYGNGIPVHDKHVREVKEWPK